MIMGRLEFCLPTWPARLSAVVDDSFGQYGLDERDGVLLYELLGFGLHTSGADSEESDGFPVSAIAAKALPMLASSI